MLFQFQCQMWANFIECQFNILNDLTHHHLVPRMVHVRVQVLQKIVMYKVNSDKSSQHINSQLLQIHQTFLWEQSIFFVLEVKLRKRKEKF